MNLENFLLNTKIDNGTYALITYNSHTEAVYFSKHWSIADNNYWFSESPCKLQKFCDVNEPIDNFCEKYMNEFFLLWDKKKCDMYIEKYLKPMISNDALYVINNSRTPNYLPKDVDSVNIVGEIECFRWLLENSTVEK